MSDEDKDRRKNRRVISVPTSLYERYEKMADEEGKFTTEKIREVLRDNAPKDKKEKEKDEVEDEGEYKFGED